MCTIFRQAVRTFASKGCKPVKKACDEASARAKMNRPSSGCIVGPSGVYPAVEGGYKLWRNMSLFVCIPIILVCAVNLYNNYEEHERPPFVKYEYMRIRHKKFPWCGGTDRSFFHNPRLNALPDGYEDIDEDE